MIPYSKLGARISGATLSLILLGGCALTGAGNGTDRSAVVSTSDALQLTAQDYREMLAVQPREKLSVYAHSQDQMRDLALDLHSDVVLAAQAEAEGIDRDPRVASALGEARRRILVTALMERVRDGVAIPADLTTLAKERYLRDKEKLVTLERRKVAHILLTELYGCPCEVKPLGQRVLDLQQKLKGGADFAEAARKLSQDFGSAPKGGELPDWVQRDGKTVRPFEDAVFKLKKVGDISEPVATQFGIHFVKLLEVEPSRQLSYEEVEEKLKLQLAGELRFSALEQRRGFAYPDPTQINYGALEPVLKELIKQSTAISTPAVPPGAQPTNNAPDAKP